MHRKSLLIAVLLVIACVAMVLCSCTAEGKYKVTYSVDGQVYSTATVNRGGRLVLPEAPKKSGYRFEGWYLDDGVWTQPFNEKTSVIADITVYAHWLEIINPEPQSYVITFDSTGGSAVKSIRVRSGVEFTLPTNPERADYTFEGWYTDTSYQTTFTQDTVVTRDMTVYAKWTLKNSDTYFNVKDGILTSLTEDGKKSKELSLPLQINGVDIVGIGDELFKDDTVLTSVTFPKGSKYKSIGARAFENCTSLTTVKFSNSVTEIGAGAFSGCKALVSAQLPTELKRIEEDLFSGCSALTTAVAPGAEYIGARAFADCTKLVAFSVSESVTEIGEKAFYRCIGMTSLALRANGENGVRKIGAFAFYYCQSLKSIVIPNTVTELGESAFYMCNGATDLTVGAGITSIPQNAFGYMSALTSVTFGSDITAVGEKAFAFCKALKTLSLPDSVTTLGVGFAMNCTGLEKITVPASVTIIPESAFENCIKLTSITLPQGLTEIGARAFKSCVKLKSDGLSLPNTVCKIGNSAFRDCSVLTAFTMPSALNAVSEGTFYDCKMLSEIDFGESAVTEIGKSAFYGCQELTSLTLPDSVNTVAASAFYGCNGLTEVTFGSALATVGDEAFAYCSSLTNVTFSVNTSTLSGTSFKGDSALRAITVPEGNPYFKSVDGVLFGAGGATLALYPSSKTATTYAVPTGVVTINDGVFVGNTTLTSVILPDTLESIGANAFKNCTALTSINYPSSLRSIGESAFAGCTALTTAELNVGLRTLGAYAFEGDTSLTSARLPATLVSVGSTVFGEIGGAFVIDSDMPLDNNGNERELPFGWHKLWANSGKKYTYTINRNKPVTGTEYDYVARDNQAVLVGYHGKDTEVTVPSEIDGNTVIGLFGTFDGNTSITSVTIPDSVSVIADTTLRGCTALTTLVTPFIGAYRGAVGAFGLIGYMFTYSDAAVTGWVKQPAQGGSNYYYVNVPSSLASVTVTDTESIAYGAFASIHSIRNITLCNGLKTIGGRAFNDVSVLTITIPESVEYVGEYAFTRSYLDYYDKSETVEPTLTVKVAFTRDNIPVGFLNNECFVLSEDKTSYGTVGVRIEFRQ